MVGARVSACLGVTCSPCAVRPVNGSRLLPRWYQVGLWGLILALLVGVDWLGLSLVVSAVTRESEGFLPHIYNEISGNLLHPGGSESRTAADTHDGRPNTARRLRLARSIGYGYRCGLPGRTWRGQRPKPCPCERSSLDCTLPAPLAPDQRASNDHARTVPLRSRQGH